NPDGVAAHTRQNAHGVDLNRNFPWRWRRLGSRGYRYYSGPRPLSEPETRLAARIILRLRPVVSIWFHQPYGLVDESGGDLNPERARFCLACGAPLVEQAEPAEERKVVSVLFVDLVGFTNRSDRADPEDVRAILRPYHARMKHEIERFGGTIEKFVGDAVMAVFGAPAAHEDDAERAVRAALRILDAIDALNS